MSGLERRIGFVEGVTRAVIVEREYRRRAMAPHGPAVVTSFVDVIAEMDHEIQIVPRHVLVRGVVADFVLLTRCEGEAQPRRGCIGRGMVRVRPFGLTSLPALN